MAKLKNELHAKEAKHFPSFHYQTVRLQRQTHIFTTPQTRITNDAGKINNDNFLDSSIQHPTAYTQNLLRTPQTRQKQMDI